METGNLIFINQAVENGKNSDFQDSHRTILKVGSSAVALKLNLTGRSNNASKLSNQA